EQAAAERGGEAVRHPRLWVPPLNEAEFFDDLFNPIARDGASLVEVQIRLQKALAALAELGFPEPARRHGRLALARAEAALVAEEDKANLRQRADWLDS
ncbi:DUF2254 family protein, partial [Alloalcanivorax gelatiniphagus]